MKTKILKEEAAFEAKEALKRGEVVAFATETVYGLGAQVGCLSAIEKIFSIKGRPKDNPLIVHVGSIQEAAALARDLPLSFFHLAKAFWPGPLTLVVKKAASVLPIVSAGLDSVALRLPSHPVAQSLIAFAGPLVAPSANLSGRPSPTCAEHVLEDLDGKIGWIVDGGRCSLGIESTVISLLHNEPVLLRPGSISKAMVEETLGCSVQDPLETGPIHSPGMKYRHYAPKAKVRLVYDSSKLVGPCILSPNPSSHMRLLNEQTLYAELRRADLQKFPEIEIDCTPSLIRNTALMNRIRKSAGE